MRLVGECNRCGACYRDRDGYACLHLLPDGDRTRCEVYDRRYDGMPIVLIAPDGLSMRGGTCAKDSPAEARAIVERGIGRGCSLAIADRAEVPILTFIRKEA